MKTIHLARGLTLPAAELATEVVASLGQRGGGKSNGAAVIAEGLLEAGVQVIVLDHVGIWFSLRLDETGKHPSPYQIPVLGGQHGDIALVASTGGVVAEALAVSGSSAVLDVSSFSKGDRCRFAADFAEAFFRVKKLHPGPVQILLEEAQRYVPQKLFAGQGLERMLGAFEEIAEVGRNYGVGLHLISQRPQKINKDVLNLADTVLAYRSNGVLERKAISEWVQEKGAEGRKEVHDELPGLARGQAIVWSPNRAIYSRYSVHKKSTYDAGATPIHARAAVKTKRLDLESLESAMGKAVEESKANDPRVLKARIAELERAKTVVKMTMNSPGRTKVVPMLGKRDLARLERLVEKLGKSELKFMHDMTTNASAIRMFADGIEKGRDRLAQAQQAVVSEVGNLVTTMRKAMTPADQRARESWKDWTEKDVKQELQPIRGNTNGRRDADVLKIPPGVTKFQTSYTAVDETTEHLPDKSQAMLGALMQGEAMGLKSMPFKNVALIAGVSPTSGTTSNRKRSIVQGGYAIVQGDHLALTDKGRAYPLNIAMPPTDRDGLLNYWKREIGTEKVVAMLDFVVTRGVATDEELRGAAQMENSGTFSNYKRELTGRGLMVKSGNGYVPSEVFNR